MEEFLNIGIINPGNKNQFKKTVPLKTADQLERELNAFTTAIQEAACNSTSVIKTNLKGLNFPK
jgi:hypothetical protein